MKKEESINRLSHKDGYNVQARRSAEEERLTALSSALDEIPWNRKEDARKIIEDHYRKAPDAGLDCAST